MAKYSYSDLRSGYEGFYNPAVYVYVNEKDVERSKNSNVSVSDLSVELSSEYKANIATFTLTGAFDSDARSFDVDNSKNFILMGSAVKIFMGYGIKVTEVFRGYIARVSFNYDSSGFSEPGITVTAMDVKGIMMSNNYSKRLTASYYSDAVSEIFEQTAYQNLINSGIIERYAVSATPDKPQGAGDMGGLGGLGGGMGGSAGQGSSDTPSQRIEMTSESDYDFVVKAAKKFGYEFFSLGSYVYFRKAKDNAEVLLEITAECPIYNYNIEYDITGIVGAVEVRGVDVDKGNMVKSTVKNTNKLSLGSKAKSLVSSQTRIFIDSSTDTKETADIRAGSILEDMSYRLGSLDMEIIGIPELLPGSYVEISGLGTAISNKFYLTEVIHYLDADGNYITRLLGKAASLPN